MSKHKESPVLLGFGLYQEIRTIMVRVTGLEPAQRKLLGPKPSASTNSATPART